jgi:hypothetical protein
MIVHMPSWLTGALAALAVGAASCSGDGDGDPPRAATPSPSPSSTATPEREVESAPPDAADVQVVRKWADTLRAGHIRAAARYFALPSLVSNGTPPIKLETRAEAEFFNRTLPCGAELIETEPAPHGFFIATFRLTERPGPGECGSGTGETARTAFRVRDAHITDWLRVRDIESAPESLS